MAIIPIDHLTSYYQLACIISVMVAVDPEEGFGGQSSSFMNMGKVCHV